MKIALRCFKNTRRYYYSIYVLSASVALFATFRSLLILIIFTKLFETVFERNITPGGKPAIIQDFQSHLVAVYTSIIDKSLFQKGHSCIVSLGAGSKSFTQRISILQIL